MIRRTMDAGFVNALANRPDIRPYIGGGLEALDLTSVVENPENYVIQADGGCWILHALTPGAFELHTLFATEGRGRSYFGNAREAIRWMVAHTDAIEILTKGPDDNPGARVAAVLCGFKERFRREDAWHTGVGIAYLVLTIDQWCFSDPETRKAGRAFHAALEDAKKAAGSELPSHPDDDAYDHAAGAAVLMGRARNLTKGLVYYNSWAVFAGYAPIRQLGPSLVDLHDAVVEVHDGEMHVLLTR